MVSADLLYSGRGYAFTIGIGCCGGLFLEKQACDQIERTPQNTHQGPRLGQILKFGGPDRCSPLGKSSKKSCTAPCKVQSERFGTFCCCEPGPHRKFLKLYGRYWLSHKGFCLIRGLVTCSTATRCCYGTQTQYMFLSLSVFKNIFKIFIQF